MSARESTAYDGAVTHTVAVVVSAFNAARYLPEALDSIAAQVRRPDEVVLVDDGSTDESASIMEAWAHASAVPSELVRQRNRGMASGRNAGVSRSRASLVAFLDADDIWQPHHLGRSVQAFEREPSTVLTFANLRSFGVLDYDPEDYLSDKRVRDLEKEERHDGFYLLRGDVFSTLVAGTYVLPTTTVVRRDAGDAAGWFEPGARFAEDRDLVLRLSVRGDFGYFPAFHARRRCHPQSVTAAADRAPALLAQLELLTRTLDRRAELGLDGDQIRATRQARREAGEDHLYASSAKGWGAFARCVPLMARHGMPLLPFHPRTVARAVARTLRPGAGGSS